MAVIIPTAAKNLVRSKFLGKDFDTYVQEIVQFMQLEFDPTTFNNFFASELGIMLVETVAFALSQASWYIDRQVGENFLQTAVLRNSVARLSYQLGFKMPGAVGPSVDLTVSFSAAQPFNVTIPKGFQFISTTGLIYQSTANLLFTAGEVGPKTLTVIQGETRQEFFVSDGTANQIFQLQSIPAGQSIAESTVNVTVDSVTWLAVDFLEFEPINEFAVELNREPPQIRFGDGIAGNLPANGADINVTYVTTLGPAGTVLANEIQQPKTPLVVGVTTVPLVITNPLPSTAGGAAMSLDTARVLAPQVFATAKRVVTEEDYDAIINSFFDPVFGTVAVGKANIIRGMLDDSTFVTDFENLNILAGQLPATLTVHSPNPQGNIVYTANDKGVNGNVIRITQANNGPALPLTVTVTGPVPPAPPAFSDIAIQLATNGLSAILTNGTQLQAAIVADADANQLVTAALDGAGGGVVGTIVQTALTGGAPYVPVQDIIKFDATTAPSTWGTLPQEINVVTSAACKANLVEVQILAADATGRYIAPTVGLAQSLKTKLESMKESTVQILVFDGSRELFAVNVLVQAKVFDGFATSEVLNNVKIVAEQFLLGFDYARSARISDLYQAVEAVSGVDYSHIFFSVPTAPALVDPLTGDVVVADNQVITLGTATVSPI